MKSYFKKHYNGSNCSVVIAGNLPKNYASKVRKYASTLSGGKRTSWKPVAISPKKFELHYKKTEQAHIGFALPAYDIFSEKRYALAVIASILGGYMSARLFTEIREKRGWAYRVWAFAEEATDCGYLGAFGGVKKDKAVESLKIIKSEIANFAQTVTDEEIFRAVENIKGSSVLKYDSPEEVGNYVMMTSLLKGFVELPDESVKKIAKVTKKQVIEVAEELFKNDKYHITVIGPFKDKKKFVKILAEPRT